MRRRAWIPKQRCHPFGRLRDGMTRVRARESLTGFPGDPPPVRPFSGFGAYFAQQGDDYRMFVFFMMLIGIAMFLALIACSNVVGLLLARRAARYREMTIRQALGANRWQLARPLLCEALVLVACGAAAGLTLDTWLRGHLRYLRWPTAYNIPFEFHFESDHSLLLYALLTACAALLVCAPVGAVKPPSTRWNLRSGFVALQVVLSMVLLTLGALFARSFLHVANLDVGFDTVHTVIAAVHPPPRADRGWAWRERLADAVRRVPGVEAVTSTDLLPLMGEVPDVPLRRAGDPSSAARDVYAMAEGEQYFATLRIPILRGRDFEMADRERKPIASDRQPHARPAILRRRRPDRRAPDPRTREGRRAGDRRRRRRHENAHAGRGRRSCILHARLQRPVSGPRLRRPRAMDRTAAPRTCRGRPGTRARHPTLARRRRRRAIPDADGRRLRNFDRRDRPRAGASRRLRLGLLCRQPPHPRIRHPRGLGRHPRAHFVDRPPPRRMPADRRRNGGPLGRDL